MENRTGSVFVKLSTIVAVFFLMITGTAVASDWSQFQKNVHNTGTTSDQVPLDVPDSGAWEVNFAGDYVNCVPLVVDDSVFVALPHGTISSLDKNTGNAQWETIIDSTVYALGNLALGNNTLFVPREDGKIYAFDSETGIELWNVSAGNKFYSPVVYEDHRLYVGDCADISGSNGNYFCYSDDGVEIWKRAATGNAGYYWSGAAIVDDFLIYGDSQGYITSVYKANGTTVDEVNVSAEFGTSDNMIRSSICYDSTLGRIFFSSRGGYIYSLGMNSDGTINTSVKQSFEIGVSTSTPSVYNGRIYVGSGKMLSGSNYKKLYCLNSSSLNEIWNFTANGPIQASPVLSTYFDDGDGEVYILFTSNDVSSRVYCLKDYSGNTESILQWYYEAPASKNEYTLQGVSVSDGRIFFGNDAGYVFGLAPKVASFTSNVTSGTAPFTVQFTDLTEGSIAWEWDVNGDGVAEYHIQNPVHEYTSVGTYTVSLNVTTADQSDTLKIEDYIYAGDDWNPWNDPDSDGMPDGAYITIDEVIEAYGCYIEFSPAPGSGVSINIDRVIELYTAYIEGTPM